MPELPEVETIRRHLAPHVEGRVLQELDVEDPRWCEPLAVAELRDAVEGRVIERLGRRGKYLVWELADEMLTASRDQAETRRPSASEKKRALIMARATAVANIAGPRVISTL